MDETFWLTLPFDDDDDDFSFEDGHAELALELGGYADDDDEFDEFDRTGVTFIPDPPTPSETIASGKKKK